MGLADVLSNVGQEEFQKDLDREKNQDVYMPQESFPDCMARAEAMMYNGITRMKKIYALAIVTHRERDHGEDHGKEREELISTMETEDIITAETKGWWSD